MIDRYLSLRVVPTTFLGFKSVSLAYLTKKIPVSSTGIVIEWIGAFVGLRRPRLLSQQRPGLADTHSVPPSPKWGWELLDKTGFFLVLSLLASMFLWGLVAQLHLS